MSYVYSLLFKRYAPFTSFGGGFHGDERDQPRWAGSARVHASIPFDFTNGVIGDGVAWSSPTFRTKSPSKKKTSTPKLKILSRSFKDGTVKFKAHSAGSNPMISVSPPIDTFVDVEITESHIKGTVSGDSFPNCEIFLERREARAPDPRPTISGVDVMLVSHFRTSYGELRGPATLFGKGENKVFDRFNLPIAF